MTERYGRWGQFKAMSAWQLGAVDIDGRWYWYRSRKRFSVEVSQEAAYGWWTIKVFNPNGKEIARMDVDATERGAKCAATRALRKHAP